MLKRFKKIDKPLLIITIILIAIGLVMIFSASNVAAFRSSGDSYRYLKRQLMVLAVCAVATIVILKFKTSSYKALSWAAVIGIGLALAGLFVLGTVRNDTLGWYDLGPFLFQPSEFAKVILIVWMASYYDTKKKENLEQYMFVFFPVIVAVVFFFLIMFQPDLGTALIFSFIAMYMFFASPISKKIKKQIGMLLFFLVVMIILIGVTTKFSFLEEHQRERIFMSMSNPCSSENFYDQGNQLCNGYIAINNGGLFGLGLGNSIQKNLYLPEAYTDFIFCIIMEELGLVGAGVILLLYFLLIGRIVKIGKDSKTDRGAMLCYGIAVYFLIHIVVNLLGIFGWLPMTGIPLPFLSYGGSYTICTLSALAIVQRVNIENVNEREKEMKQNVKKTKKLAPNGK